MLASRYQENSPVDNTLTPGKSPPRKLSPGGLPPGQLPLINSPPDKRPPGPNFINKRIYIIIEYVLYSLIDIDMIFNHKNSPHLTSALRLRMVAAVAFVPPHDVIAVPSSGG